MPTSWAAFFLGPAMSLSRRTFLKSGLGGAGGWLAASGARVSAAMPAEDPYASQAVVNPDPRQRLVIVNADVGMSEEVDRGIFDALDRGIVTSASVMVDGPHAVEAIRLAKRRSIAWQFLEAGARYGVPVRGFSEVFYVGRFWAQPEFGRTDTTKISAESLAGGGCGPTAAGR